MHRPVAGNEGSKGRSLKAVGEWGWDILSVIMVGSMRSHALRKSLRTPVLDSANDTAVVENVRAG